MTLLFASFAVIYGKIDKSVNLSRPTGYRLGGMNLLLYLQMFREANKHVRQRTESTYGLKKIYQVNLKTCQKLLV